MCGNIGWSIADTVIDAIHVGHEERAQTGFGGLGHIMIGAHAPDLFAKIGQWGWKRDAPIAIVPPDVETLAENGGEVRVTILNLRGIERGERRIHYLRMIIEFNMD